jgi:hypothetical protein
MTDFYNLFSDQQAITVSAASNATGNGGVIDLLGSSTDVFFGATLQPNEGGNMLYLKVSVGSTQFVGAGATLTCELQESPDKSTWANTIIGSAVAVPVAQLLPGQILLWAPLPFFGGSILPPQRLLRYLRMWYIVTGGPFTAGTINAQIETY